MSEATATPVVMVMLEQHKITQYNFAFERADSTIKVKFFVAPYATWWLGEDNCPVKLEQPEVDMMYGYLRTVQRVRRNIDQSRRQPVIAG